MNRAALLDRMRARAADLEALYVAALPTMPDHVALAVHALHGFVRDELGYLAEDIAEVIDPWDLVEVQDYLEHWRELRDQQPGGLTASYAAWFVDLFSALESEALDAMLAGGES